MCALLLNPLGLILFQYFVFLSLRVDLLTRRQYPLVTHFTCYEQTSL